MENRQIIRQILLILASFMFCYQTQIAVKSIMDPPLMVTTDILPISAISPPLMMLCPLNQFDVVKMDKLKFDDELSLLVESITAGTPGYLRSWNMTFEQLIRNVVKETPEKLMARIQDSEYGNVRETLTTKLFPTFGFCFEITNFGMEEMIMIPSGAGGFIELDFTLFITDNLTSQHRLSIVWTWNPSLVTKSGY